MKRLLVFLGIMACVALTGSVRPGELRILTGAGTDPQTLSFFTTKGFYPNSWTMKCWGAGCMVKFRGVGSDQDWWHRMEAGDSFESPCIDGLCVSVDTIIIDPDATATFGFVFVGYKK